MIVFAPAAAERSTDHAPPASSVAETPFTDTDASAPVSEAPPVTTTLGLDTVVPPAGELIAIEGAKEAIAVRRVPALRDGGVLRVGEPHDVGAARGNGVGERHVEVVFEAFCLRPSPSRT